VDHPDLWRQGKANGLKSVLPVDDSWKITFFNLYKQPSYPQDAQWQMPKGKHKLDVEIDQVTVSRFGMSGGSYVMSQVVEMGIIAIA